MAEYIQQNGRVGETGICMFCGAKNGKRRVDGDHMYPRFLIKHPKELEIHPSHHPMWVVVHNTTNMFYMCRDLHEALDKGKGAVFKGRSLETVDPEALVKYLMETYPITRDLRYAGTQVDNMIATNRRFIDAVCGLNGELPKPLVRRYGKASGVAFEFNQQLGDVAPFYHSVIKIENLDQETFEIPEYLSEMLTYSSLNC